MKKRLSIGSRGSKLALQQANIIGQRLKASGCSNVDIFVIKTRGDKILSMSVMDIGGKGIFVREIEKELLNKNIDLAVHSLKDMPSTLPTGLTIGAYLKADDTRDVLCSRTGCGLFELPAGAKIGTGSPRRKAQLKLLRPDLESISIRGNVDTRIRRVENGDCDAAILAYAGLKRLGLEDSISETFSTKDMIPAPGQGVIAVEVRSKDAYILDILKPIDDKTQRTISEIEFGILSEIGATCSTPIGMSSKINGGNIIIDLFLGDADCAQYIKKRFEAPCKDISGAVYKISTEIRDEWVKVTGKEIIV